MKPNDIVVQQLNRNNFPKFHQLFQQVFKKKQSLAWLQNKYDTAYLSIKDEYLGCLALNDRGEAVSYCGHIPFRFEVDGQQFIGAHSCDHMTLEAYRGQGLFQQLNNQAEELVVAAGISLIYGFPNQNNHPILVKHAQWEIIDTMQVFVFPVKTLPVAAVLAKNSVTRKLYENWSQRIRATYPKITDPISSVQQLGILRDEAFYQYKRAFRSSEIRDFKNGTVWFHLSSQLAIGDLVLHAGGNAADLIHELQAFARKLGVTQLLFLCSSYHPLATSLAKLVAPVIGNGVGVKYIGKQDKPPLSPLVFTYGDFDTF